MDGDGAISDKEFELYDSNDEYETADHDVDGDGTLDLQGDPSAQLLPSVDVTLRVAL